MWGNAVVVASSLLLKRQCRGISHSGRPSLPSPSLSFRNLNVTEAPAVGAAKAVRRGKISRETAKEKIKTKVRMRILMSGQDRAQLRGGCWTIHVLFYILPREDERTGISCSWWWERRHCIALSGGGSVVSSFLLLHSFEWKVANE